MARAFARKMYAGKKWQKCREYIFNKYHGLCQDCGKPGEEVHHKIYLTPQNINDPDVVYGEDNLVLLCRDCHYSRHTKRRKGVDDSYYFDDEGNMCKKEMITEMETKVYIVYGCPGCGKNTYIKERMTKGDMVIDLDLIAQAIGLQMKAETPEGLIGTALRIRDHMYNLVASRDIKCGKVWIAAGLPNKKEREELNHRVRADELIFIDINKKDCIERIMNDPERINKIKQIEIINKWFKEYES